MSTPELLQCRLWDDVAGKSIFFISTTSVLELLSVSVSRIDVVGTKLIERVRMLYKKDVDTITEAVAGDKKEVLTLINHCLAAHQVNHQQIYYQHITINLYPEVRVRSTHQETLLSLLSLAWQRCHHPPPGDTL